MNDNRTARPMPRWPLVPIALPAAVAIWSGWVGLGGLCGFGVVNLLPGIGGGFHLNTAITLPVGVEAYGAFALGAWMSPASPRAARKFAKRSAISALLLGCAGQIVFHLLAASGAGKAPWPVVVAVSCMPVIVLGFAAALTHLLRVPAGPETASPAASVGVSVKPRLPVLREIQARQSCGQETAKKVLAELRTRDAQWAQLLKNPPAGRAISLQGDSAMTPAGAERSRGGPMHPAPVPAAQSPAGAGTPAVLSAPAGATLNGNGGT